MSLDAIYEAHPVSERNILARLRRQSVPLSGLTEWSLAIDPDTDITDQNHPGGAQSVLELAIAARLSAASTVIDVGAGIGGSARVLAQALGCSVVAIERDSERCQQAIRLTALVGLSDRVRWVHHDALLGMPDVGYADVLWGQNAWAHFPSPKRFLDFWFPAVKPSGRVALSDAFLAREPVGLKESELVGELQRLWAVHLVSVDRWRRALETKECELIHEHDRTEEARLYFKSTLAVSSTWPPGTVTAEEKRGWIVGEEALHRGLIEMRQIIACRT